MKRALDSQTVRSKEKKPSRATVGPSQRQTSGTDPLSQKGDLLERALSSYSGWLTITPAMANHEFEVKGKGLLFNVGSLQKSPPGMDGTIYFQQSPRCMSVTSPIIQSRLIMLVTLPG